MSRASRFVIRAVVRLIWAKSVRGLTVLLLGGVLVTLLVHAVEGQGTRDPVTQAGPFLVADGDAGKAKSPQQGGASSGHGSTSAKPGASGSYVSPILAGTTTYAQVDAGLFRSRPNRHKAPAASDSSQFAHLTRSFLRRPRIWGRITLPKDIQQMLGDVEVYILIGGGTVREMWGIRGGRYYDLPVEMNQFVYDGGLQWSLDNATQLVRAYSLFLAVEQRLYLSGSIDALLPTRISQALVDSLFNGSIPLVPAFSVRSVRTRLGSDRGSTPAGTVSSLSAAVDWGDYTEAATVEFACVAGIPGMSFPKFWDWRGGTEPWGLKLRLPSPPERRGG